MESHTQDHAYENWTVAFFLSMVSEVTVQKNSKQTLLQVEKLSRNLL